MAEDVGGSQGSRDFSFDDIDRADYSEWRRRPSVRDVSGKIQERMGEREERREAGELAGQKARGAAEQALTRTLSGAIYAIAIFVLVFLGPLATTFLTGAIAWLCCSEFFRLARLLGRNPFEFLGLAGAVAFPVAAYLGDNLSFWVLYALLIAAGVWFVFTPRASIVDIAITVFAPIYTGWLISSLVYIRMMEAGAAGALMTLGVLGSIWANDAAAYAVGRRFGRTKMSPRISPNKTWEGFWGGMVGSFILWLAMFVLRLPGITIPIVVIGAVATALASVVGDLTESRIKRAAGVKDSGDFMPGHGGLLDRTDSQLFGCMTGYLVLHLGGIL